MYSYVQPLPIVGHAHTSCGTRFSFHSAEVCHEIEFRAVFVGQSSVYTITNSFRWFAPTRQSVTYFSPSASPLIAELNNTRIALFLFVYRSFIPKKLQPIGCFPPLPPYLLERFNDHLIIRRHERPIGGEKAFNNITLVLFDCL